MLPSNIFPLIISKGKCAYEVRMSVLRFLLVRRRIDCAVRVLLPERRGAGKVDSVESGSGDMLPVICRILY